MKIIKYLFLGSVILAASALTGCNKEKIISSSGDKAPVFAAEYIGTFKIEYSKNNFPFKRDDSVVLRIDQTDYELYIIGSRSTLICDSKGIFTYNTESKTIFLVLRNSDFDLCDTLRIPRGLFAATVTESALNFDGFHVVPETTDTIWYDFRLIVSPTI